MSNMFSRIPQDQFSMIGYLSLHGIQNRKREAIRTIKAFKDRKILYKISEFVEYAWFESCKGDFDSLEGIGHLPINQAIFEYYDCIEMAILAQYRAAYSSLRRMYEMAILQLYFSADGVDKRKAKLWFLSKGNTPNFSTMVDWLAKQKRFSAFDEIYKYSDVIKNTYHEICDIVHIKGLDKTYLRFQNSTSSFNGYQQKSFDSKLFEKILDDIINIFSTIAIYYTLSNPIIWVGLPMWEKFGENPPLSGFLSENQSKIVHDIMKNEFKEYFDNLALIDEDVVLQKEWVIARPDLTEAEILEQLNQFEEMINKY